MIKKWFSLSWMLLLLKLNYRLYYKNKPGLCREVKSLSQKELAKLLNTSYSVIGKYERDEMLPSIEAAKKIAKLVDTTVGYLLEETEQANLFKAPVMLQRLNDINDLPEADKHCILYTIDNLIQNVKAKKAFAVK